MALVSPRLAEQLGSRLLQAPWSCSSLHRQHALHRVRTLVTAALAEDSRQPYKLVFLGTPEVAATTLNTLLQASQQPDASFQVAGVVTQPGRPKGRGNRSKPQPSPVEEAARAAGLPDDVIFCPVKARDPAFLERLRVLAPDLCVTAAYGNILPQAFLDIPRWGTLNIHPSLLPKYRGAAPVQRQLQDNESPIGVSLAFTVRAMDAGPVLDSESVLPVDSWQTPQMLEHLFSRGIQLLLNNLDLVWSGKAWAAAKPQDEAAATHAAKLTRADSLLDWDKPAQALHNQVRAFQEWPSTEQTFCVVNENSQQEYVKIQVLQTRVGSSELWDGEDPLAVIPTRTGGLLVQCNDKSILELLRLRPQGRKAMDAAAWVNGLRNREVKRLATGCMPSTTSSCTLQAKRLPGSLSD